MLSNKGLAMQVSLRYSSVVLLGCLCLASCSDPKPGAGSSAGSGGERRIIILTNGNSPFWDACRAGLQEAEKDLKLNEAGLSAVLENSEPTPQGQLDRLRQFASQSDIAAVGVSAIDAANIAIANQLRDLGKKGVKIVTIDSDVDRDKMRDARFAFIGTDNLTGGRELGKCAAGLRPEGGEYVTFVGRTGAQNAIERIGGFGEGAGPKFKQVDSMADGTDRTRARENVRNAIKNHPELKVLVGIWSYNAPAIVDVVKELNKREAFTIVAFDAEPLAVKAMDDGQIDAMVVQNPYQMGYQGVKLMKALVKDDQKTIHEMLPRLGQANGDIYDTGLKVVAPDATSQLKPDMFQKNTEFLKLSEFKKWLAKYELQGS
jgi:ribose transport system substrate-binding protein